MVGGGEGLSGGHFCTTWRNICRARACKACERDHPPGTTVGRILAELSRSRWFARAWEVSLPVVSSTFRFAAQRQASRCDRRQLARGCGVPAIDRAAHGAHVLQSPRTASLSAVTTPATSKQASGADCCCWCCCTTTVCSREGGDTAAVDFRRLSFDICSLGQDSTAPFYTAEPPCTAGA